MKKAQIFKIWMRFDLTSKQFDPDICLMLTAIKHSSFWLKINILTFYNKFNKVVFCLIHKFDLYQKEIEFF